MILNLETKTKEHEIIKKYLQDNVSETLADKINNGVQITKDGKQLINKKTLVGFMSYATEQAKKQAEKGANSACIEDKVVFGWAIHYFEEDELIGELFNLDGSKYEPQKTKYTPPKTTTAITKSEPKVVAKETTLFDFIEDNNKEEQLEQVEENELEETAPLGVEEKVEIVEQPKETNHVSIVYTKYMNIQNKYPNSVICYKLGDFYEVFGDFAVKVAKELDLTLTGRDCGLKERVPMVGFPYHIQEKYFKLINEHYDLIVVDGNNETHYSKYEPETYEEKNINMETGEIITEQDSDDLIDSFDKKLLLDISILLEDKIIVE